MGKADYLAAHYLTADTKDSTKSKKRKRKTAATGEGLTIADDDDFSWKTAATNDDEDGPQISNNGSAEFRRSKKNAWKIVGSAAPKDSDLDAERIIADTAAENARRRDDDDAPVIEDANGVIKMGDGTHAGLQTAAAVSAQMARRAAEENAAWAAEEKRLKKEGKSIQGGETVYRDATGRRIDISMRRAELRAAEEEKAKRQREKELDAKGDVQRRAMEERREQLQDAMLMPVARKIDDEDMNRELKERDRWNDPMAQFLSQPSAANAGGTRTAKSQRKTYACAAAPNRYGIRPGWRWDGVDRGNGWEGERFKALNRKTRNKDLDFAWQTDT